jgi:hypothetical protein
MASGLSQPVGRSLVIGLLAEHSLKQLDRLIPMLREERGQTGGVVRLDRSWICLGRLVLVTSGGTAGVPTRFSIAAIRRPTSEENDSCRSVIPCRLANGASTSGSSVRTGIRAPSTSTGMTGTCAAMQSQSRQPPNRWGRRAFVVRSHRPQSSTGFQ